MYNKASFESVNKGECGPWGRNRFGNAWGRGKFGGFWGRHAGGFHQPPVNIDQTDTDYVISLFAAALHKENISLSVKDDVLTISYQGTDESNNAGPVASDSYQEHQNRSFERSFRLNNKVLIDAISATYADGVLKVILPKNPDTNKPAQTITVA